MDPMLKPGVDTSVSQGMNQVQGSNYVMLQDSVTFKSPRTTAYAKITSSSL